MVTGKKVASGIGIVMARGWEREYLGKEEEKNRDDHCDGWCLVREKEGKSQKSETEWRGMGNTIPFFPPTIFVSLYQTRL